MVLKVDVVKGVGEGSECLFPFVRLQLALPNNDNVPAHVGKTLLLLLVTLTVAVYFLLPKVSISLGHSEVITALVSMPKAAVHEYTSTILPQHNVGMPRQPRVVQPIPETLSPQVFTHNNLRLRVR